MKESDWWKKFLKAVLKLPIKEVSVKYTQPEDNWDDVLVKMREGYKKKGQNERTNKV